ncbi:LMBR1 domain-containing protein [Fusarium pseudocircinatum]|uniref:LMBR1 domain-containing protein n=1 Tax=Fusarium pseudocircinatum TaxID=56676 RepID=A0A8H5UX08_9HYPO|nr:LMBR1 domain-containing protein [Fusarium pseudocircinatum]
MVSLEYVSKLLPSKGLRKLGPNRFNVSIQWKLQTPMPLVLESSELSTGTPLIGEAILDTRRDLDVKSFSVTLRRHHHYKKPLRPNCPDCAHHYVQLQRWTFIDTRIMPADGKYPFMFSMRLDNDTPPSVTTPLLDLTYEVSAELILATGEPITWNQNIDVKRSLYRPQVLRESSMRISGTPLNARLSSEQIIRLDKKVKVDFSLSKPRHGRGEIYAWEAIGVEWRIEEHVEAPRGICARHAEQEDSEPTIHRQSVSHIIAKGRPHNEWNASQSYQETTSTLSFEYGPIAAMVAKRSKSCVCEEASNTALKISHDFVLEVSLSAVTMPSDKADNTAASNSSRKIRIRRPVILTECQDNTLDNSFENLGEALPAYTRIESDLPAYLV